jgi:RNA polymerase sigma factor for flagellar operon FliA
LLLDNSEGGSIMKIEQVNVQSRNELVMNHRGFAEAIAVKIAAANPPLCLNDLIQDALLGLLDAASRFDPNRGVQFKSFAAQRIRGTVIDSLRAGAWPRVTRKTRRDIQVAREKFEREHKESPSDAELAELIGTSEKNLRYQMLRISMIEATAPNFNSNDSPGLSELVATLLIGERHATPEEVSVLEEQKRLIIAAIGRLPVKERRIIWLYYYEGLTMKLAGVEIGVVESRISQLHAKAIRRLRGYLADSLCSIAA